MPKDRPSYRPFVILVLDQETELIYKTDVQGERPTPEIILEILFKTMQGTLLKWLPRRFHPHHFSGRPSHLYEFERKVSDSQYAVNSYQATWRKLERYVLSLD